MDDYDIKKAVEFFPPYVQAARGVITALKDFREQWEIASDGISYHEIGSFFSVFAFVFQEYIAVYQRPLPKRVGSDGAIAMPVPIFFCIGSFHEMLIRHLDTADMCFVNRHNIQAWHKKHPAGLSSTGSYPVRVCENPEKLADISDEFLDKLEGKINRVSSWLDEKSQEKDLEKTIKEAKGDIELTDTESIILEALGSDTMKGNELLKKAGYSYSSHYRGILSQLFKRGILEKTVNGYKKS